MRIAAWLMVGSWMLVGLGCSARELGSASDEDEALGEGDTGEDGDADAPESGEGDGDGDGDGQLDPCLSPEICNNGDAVEVLARYFYALSHVGPPQTCAEQRELAWAITGWSDLRVTCLADQGCSDRSAELACAAACEREFATCMDAGACDPACLDGYGGCEAACGDPCSAAERWVCTLALPYDDAGALGCEGTVEGALARAEIADALAACLVDQRGCDAAVEALTCEASADEALAACDQASACTELDACWQQADELQAACLLDPG